MSITLYHVIEAVALGHNDSLKKWLDDETFIKDKIDLNGLDVPPIKIKNYDITQSFTPLSLACILGNREAVQILIKAKVDLNMTFNGIPPLHYAIMAQQINIVADMLNAEANPNCIDAHQNSALMIAAIHKQTDIATLLLRRKADPNLANDADNTPVMIAASNELSDLLTALIAYQAIFNRVDHHGNTPLHHAAAYGNLNCCRILVKNGLNINQANLYGDTPLMTAARNNQRETFKTLLELKADLYQANLWGVTPLMAFFIKFNPETSRIPSSFLTHDANLNLRDVNGMTALMYCVASSPEPFWMHQHVKSLMEFHPNAHFRSNKNIGMPQISPSLSESDKQKILARHQEFVSTTRRELLGLTALEIVNKTWSETCDSLRWGVESLLKDEMKKYPPIPETVAPPPYDTEPSAPEVTPMPSRQNSTALLPAYQNATGSMREKPAEGMLDRLFGSFRM